MNSRIIREKFLDYFKSNGHKIVPSSSLVPDDDTLLFTSAGMVQFKDLIGGRVSFIPIDRKLATVQKCLRTPDIDVVGDSVHNTFFEMLGNFSIGGYGDDYKRKAIEYAIDVLVNVYGIPLPRLRATIHVLDGETQSYWSQCGILLKRTFFFDDNWWGPVGNSGPCGPCTELHYDYGKNVGCLQDKCIPNCENVMENGEVCDRYVELWNIVFMEYYQDEDGFRTRLETPVVDTGMGFERLVRILQRVDTIYETDLYTPIIRHIENSCGLLYTDSYDIMRSMRILAEHIRSSVFLIADGVLPSNKGRGYVLRRILRRAIRHSMKLGVNTETTRDLAVITIETMKDVYPELVANRGIILSTIDNEDMKFTKTYVRSRNRLIKDVQKGGVVDTKYLFWLFETYGCPIDISKGIVSDMNIELDFDYSKLEELMFAHMARSRETSSISKTINKEK